MFLSVTSLVIGIANSVRKLLLTKNNKNFNNFSLNSGLIKFNNYNVSVCNKLDHEIFYSVLFWE